MRIRLAVILCFLFILTGCQSGGDALNRAVSLRNKILSSDGCSFRAVVSADYGEKIYVFTMDCKTDKAGNLSFTVTKPETIAGITGKITGTDGWITFDDQVLAFQTIADGQVTPVTAPWLFVKTLRSGYLKDAAENGNGIEITVDDSYEEDALQLRIQTEAEIPIFSEIFWKGRRVLTLTVENFAFV